METFGRIGPPSLKSNFEDFITGFNQAAERFSVLDVGNAKEAADAKIKAHLEDDIRLPQTFKVVFAGLLRLPFLLLYPTEACLQAVTIMDMSQIFVLRSQLDTKTN